MPDRSRVTRRRLLAAGWPAETPTLVVSRAGCADALHSSHALANLADAQALHAGRPTVVTVGVGAQEVGAAVAKPVHAAAASQPLPRKTPAPT